MIKNAINEYFAAANGFGGFRSYFNTVFERKKFNRLFILKGGPGTGKSTLMKTVLNEFEKNADCEKILCSSDPYSLDGVIIRKGKNSIAILDGTAPHEEDTRFPGAIDEIINLGEAWNERTLVKERDAIIKLTEEKKHFYASAYDILSLAGEAFKRKMKITESAYTASDDSVIIDILSKIKKKTYGRIIEKRLTSGFSKHGYKRIKCSVGERVSIVGSHGSEYIFLSHFRKMLFESEADHVILCSPFSDELTEGIYLPDTDTLYEINSDSNTVINTSRFLDDSTIKVEEPILDRYELLKNELLDNAKSCLDQASEAHFELEKIYTKAIDFETVNIITDSLLNEIKYIFTDSNC